MRLCDATKVVIYGPYAPSKGRTRWRLQVYDQSTGRKKSVTAESRAAAEALIPIVEAELQRQACLGLDLGLDPGLSLHDAIAQYLGHKRTVAGPLWVKTLGERLRAFLPDVPVSQLTPQRAEALYAKETERIGKFGVVSAATHHATLRNAKEFFRWLGKRGLAASNPFENVDPIGKANAGKPQPRETDARRLDALLFAQARDGDEGSLALLMQIYLGLRSDEVLSLQVSAVEREGHKVTIVRGKTRNARRSLEVYPELAVLLWAHCGGRPDSERVFAANLPRKPKPDWMYKRLHKRCAELGLPKFCPHSLRGLHSTLALASGATTHQVAASLGHASFATTAKHYADPAALDNARLRRVVSMLRGSEAHSGPNGEAAAESGGDSGSSLTPGQAAMRAELKMLTPEERRCLLELLKSM